MQNRIRGVNTDDLTVYTGNNSGEIYNKMFVQIKRDVTIKFSNEALKETIENAWLDFKNKYHKQAKDCRLSTILDEAEEFYKREAKRILENKNE